MKYEGSVYRPPSEADSLIVQVTIGCARNSCTFCAMYKDKQFRIRPLQDVVEDLEWAAGRWAHVVRRIFFADGDALILPTEHLKTLLDKAYELFPRCERVSVYGAPHDVLLKSHEELVLLRAAGLQMVYIGAESGDDQVLQDVKKGATAAEIIEAGKRLRAAGIQVSMTLIAGLSGKSRSHEHAVASAELVSAVKPEYLGYLTLVLREGAPLTADARAGLFSPLSPSEVADELRIFLEHVDSEGTVFRSNHASNYIALAGTLNGDRDRMLKQLDRAAQGDMSIHEFRRRLL